MRLTRWRQHRSTILNRHILRLGPCIGTGDRLYMLDAPLDAHQLVLQEMTTYAEAFARDTVDHRYGVPGLNA